jgi:molybdate transport system substrate-binding protein
MKSSTFRNLLAAVLAALLTPSLHAAEIHVFAAASLTDALKEIASGYEKKTGDKLLFNFAASNLLERQIAEGAPADLFFSADEVKMDALEKKGQLIEGTRKSLLSNSLVIVVPTDSALVLKSAKDLTDPAIKKIAVGEPKTVPVGVYAKEYLEKLGLWEQISGKIVPTENVRASLAAVESGNVEAGIVYKTDALISKKVKVAFEVPVAEGPAISYPAALVKESKVPAESKALLEFLESKEAAAIFEKFGFLVKP